MPLTPHPGYGDGSDPDLPRRPLSKVSYIRKQLAQAGTSEQLWEVDRTLMGAGLTVDLTTDKACFLAFNVVDGDLDASNSFELGAGESYNPSVLVVVYSIRFCNAVMGEQPTVRGVVWGA